MSYMYTVAVLPPAGSVVNVKMVLKQQWERALILLTSSGYSYHIRFNWQKDAAPLFLPIFGPYNLMGSLVVHRHSLRNAESSISAAIHIYIDCIKQYVCTGSICRGSDALLMPILQVASTSQVLSATKLGSHCSPAE